MTQYGKLKINTERGGEVREVIQFLSALEDALISDASVRKKDGTEIH